jgi:hypothetical protein
MASVGFAAVGGVSALAVPKQAPSAVSVTPRVGDLRTTFKVRVRLPIDLRGHARREPGLIYEHTERGGYTCVRWSRESRYEPAPLRRRGSLVVREYWPPPLHWVRHRPPNPGFHCPGTQRLSVYLTERRNIPRCLEVSEPPRRCRVTRLVGRTSWTATGRLPSGPVRVPDVRGVHRYTAECILARRGLRWRFRGETRVRGEPRSGCSIPFSPRRMVVAAQSPPPGRRVPRATTVVLALTSECHEPRARHRRVEEEGA